MTTSLVNISLPWPAPQFTLACPDTAARCAALTDATCAEPETQTAEALSSLLLHCSFKCLYIDVGCNLGYFAGLAAVHGATAECFEAYPPWVASAKRTALRNGFLMDVKHRAVISSDSGSKALAFDKLPYAPCGIGGKSASTRYQAPTVRLRTILSGRTVTLLKLDIDSNEGTLLHEATEMILRNETRISSILVELGSFNARHAADAADVPNWSEHPRGGDVRDLWRLQQRGYDVYRLNVHTNQEIYDWRGADVNRSPKRGLAKHQREHYEPMHGLRSMRKVEKLRRAADPSAYAGLVDYSQSFLITRIDLAQPAKHHDLDLQKAVLATPLNAGFATRRDTVHTPSSSLTAADADAAMRSLMARRELRDSFVSLALGSILLAYCILLVAKCTRGSTSPREHRGEGRRHAAIGVP